MARKPKDETESAAATGDIEAPATSVPPQKPRPAISIDLPASAISEVKADDARAPAPEKPAGEGAAKREAQFESEPARMQADGVPPSGPESMAPKSSGRIGVALVALLAGIGGGFIGFEIREFTKPRILTPEPLMARLGEIETRMAAQLAAGDATTLVQPFAERILKAEAALAAAAGREAALREEIGKLGAALGRESAERAKAIEGLARAPATSGGGASLAEMQTLRSRIETIQPRLDQVAGELDALARRAAAPPASDALARANARLAASNQLADAFAQGRPLARALDLLARTGVEPAKLQPLAPFVESGAPGIKALTEALKAVKPGSPAPAPPPTDTGLADRLLASARSLVEVRRSGEISGTDDAAHLARADQALSRGDVDLAVTLIGRLSATRAPDYASWLALAKQRQGAGAAILALKDEALAALAAALR